MRADGDLYNGAWTIRLRPSAAGRDADPPRRIAFEDRWRPVAHWRRANGGVRWEFEACALPAPAPADTSELVSMSVRAVNTSPEPIACALRIEVAPPPADAAWVASDAPPAGTPAPPWSAPEQVAIAGVAPALAASVTGAGATLTLAPGGSHAWHVVLAAHALPRRVLMAWARRDHEQRAAEVRAHWEAEVARGTGFRLGDREVEDAIRAARVVLLESRMRDRTVELPTAGPFQYHDTWLRDGARSVAALSVSGYTPESRRLVNGLAEYQWTTGAFLSQRGQLDGTGQAVWAFAQGALRPAPDTSLARLAEASLAACRWFANQRHFGSAAPWPFAAMLPFADPRDGELVRAQLVGNDAWALAGLESSARLLRAAHRERDAAWADSLREAYVRDFRIALARTGRRDVPPSWQGGGLDWGNLAAAWPARALPADDPRVAALAGRVWAACPEPGLVSYARTDSLHGYLGADLGTWALLAGRPADAGRVLDALLLWRDATGAGAELFSRATLDFGSDRPPHPMCAAALLMLTRNMLVYDDGDTLQLTLGPRPAWWKGARVRGAPTRFGLLDLEFSADAGAARWRWTPVRAWTALALPAGTELASAPAAPLVASNNPRIVLAPPGTGEARVSLRAVRP